MCTGRVASAFRTSDPIISSRPVTSIIEKVTYYVAVTYHPLEAVHRKINGHICMNSSRATVHKIVSMQ